MDPSGINPKTVQYVFSETERVAEELQQKFAEQAKQVGYIRDVARYSKDFWTNISGSNVAPQHGIMLQSGLSTMSQLSTEISRISQVAGEQQQCLHTLYLSASAFGSNTVIASSLVGIEINLGKIELMPVPPADEERGLAERCAKHNSALGEVCGQIWDCLYGTTHDPERSALFMIRQVYDHLFAILAPDDEVRRSAYWTRKDGDKQDLVTRRERIDYAVAEKVADSVKRGLLSEESKQMLEIYQRLNAAHERGDVDADKARKALHAMHRFLVMWLDAIGW
jgi:hypothetical protein